MTRLIVLAPIVLFYGCATQLTVEGLSVRLVSDNAECDFVGTVSTYHAIAGYDGDRLYNHDAN